MLHTRLARPGLQWRAPSWTIGLSPAEICERRSVAMEDAIQLSRMLLGNRAYVRSLSEGAAFLAASAIASRRACLLAHPAMANVLSRADRLLRINRAARPLSLFDRRACRFVHHPRRLSDFVLAIWPRLRAISLLRESSCATTKASKPKDIDPGRRRTWARAQTVRTAPRRRRTDAGGPIESRLESSEPIGAGVPARHASDESVPSPSTTRRGRSAIRLSSSA
jgi:hypothetical protein